MLCTYIVYERERDIGSTEQWLGDAPVFHSNTRSLSYQRVTCHNQHCSADAL